MFEFLEAIAAFFTTDIFGFVGDVFKEISIWFVVWWIKMQVASLTFAWEIASGVLQSLNVFSQVTSYFSFLPNDVRSGLNFFRVPEALNMLITAGMTRFVLNFIPGL